MATKVIEKIAYRLFRSHDIEDDMCLPKTLYHAHDGNMVLPLDKWLVAYQGLVCNPGGGKTFRAGWHVFPSIEDLLKYSKNMNKEYIVTPVLVKNVRSKPRSRSTVLLAKNMMICTPHWVASESLGDWLNGYV